jgi:hypothetical protein
MIAMKKLGYTLIALSAISFAAASAQEQGKSDWDKIVLEDKAGNVMTSTGGDYQTAPIGKQLVIGEHMMLGDSTKAKVVYYELDDNGKVVSRCVKDYTDPNTYIIDATCTAGAGWANGGGMSGAQVGMIVGAGVIGAALINNQDKTEVGPLSNGTRRL